MGPGPGPGRFLGFPDSLQNLAEMWSGTSICRQDFQNSPWAGPVLKIGPRREVKWMGREGLSGMPRPLSPQGLVWRRDRRSFLEGGLGKVWCRGLVPPSSPVPEGFRIGILVFADQPSPRVRHRYLLGSGKSWPCLGGGFLTWLYSGAVWEMPDLALVRIASPGQSRQGSRFGHRDPAAMWVGWATGVPGRPSNAPGRRWRGSMN